ncbi:MAG: glycosyltransferase family 4 protein [Deltaproteobacteria bacterium]|nr:glycosyltransferase family 4 protein [Deltaproteobacteria bacterium]
MRVAIISKALTVREYQTKLDALAAYGDAEITAITPPRWGACSEGVGAKKCRVITAHARFNGYPHIHFYPRIARILEEINPDIVHIDEEYYILVTFQLMRIAKMMGRKALFFTWQNIYKRYPFPFSAIERYNLRTADGAIAGNHEAKAVLKRKGFRKEVFIIPQFGVDEERFRKIANASLRTRLCPEKSFLIGYLGRLVPEKGIEDLLKAITLCNADAKAVLVGDGPLRSSLLSLSTQLGLGNRLKILDRVRSTKIPEYLNCLDCLVLPSRTTRRWKEQFGRVLIEAMACEVPVVGSSSGEIPNVVGDAGLIFREGDPEDLAKKLQILHGDRELHLRLAKAGRERVLQKFTQKKIAEQIYRAYLWLMGGNFK